MQHRIVGGFCLEDSDIKDLELEILGQRRPGDPSDFRVIAHREYPSSEEVRPKPSCRSGNRPLVIEDLANSRLLLLGELARVARQVLAHSHPALDRRPLADLVEPALEMLEIDDVLPLTLPVDRPWIGDNVGDRILIAGEIRAVMEPVVEHAIEPVRLVRETGDRIGLIALATVEPAEMAALAELRSLVRHLPHHPLG